MTNKSGKTQAHRAFHAPLFLQALEPRVLLDAAAAQTANEAAQQQADPAPAQADAPSDHAYLLAALNTLDESNAPTDNPPTPADADVGLAPVGIYFIDRRVDDPDQLARNLPPGPEVYFIDPGTDGVAFIAQTLAGRSEVSAIHILSHGEAGALQLGNVTLTLESMQGTFRDELQAIGRSLSANADILIYGCDFAQGETGAAAAQTLSALTGADVAASIDDTGAASLGGDLDLGSEVGAIEGTTPGPAHASPSIDDTGAPWLGGDWDLERQVGAIEATTLAAADWNYLLSPALSLTSAPNLVANGSFTNDTTGWTANPTGDVNNALERGTNPAQFMDAGTASVSPDGGAFVEIEGGPLNPATTRDYIEYTVTTEVGQTYVFSAFARSRAGQTDRGSLYAGGNTILTFSTASSQWSQVFASFAATSTSTVIRIYSEGSTAGGGPLPGDQFGLLVDGIAVREAYQVRYVEGAEPVGVVNPGIAMSGASGGALSVRQSESSKVSSPM